MKILSMHTANDYMYELQQNMGSSTDLGVDRFTGVILGRFFCITHHNSYKWEYKYSCQKNTATGIVCDSPDSCTVKYYTTTGNCAHRCSFLFTC